MSLTDRDRKTILLLLIIAVVALPYTFYIQDTREDTEKVKAEIVTLTETFNRLNKMNEKRDFYISETQRYKKETQDLIAMFPADVLPENYTMFLLNTEYSSKMIPVEVEEGEEDYGLYELEYPIRFKTVSYGINEEFALASDEVQLDYTALTNRSGVIFYCKYDALKYMLKYLMDWEDPMIYSTMKLEIDKKGMIKGEMILEQYAIAGGDRKIKDVVIDPDIDKMKIRGVDLDETNENGIFGSTHTLTWEEVEEEDENGGDNDGDNGDGGDDAGDAEVVDAE